MKSKSPESGGKKGWIISLFLTEKHYKKAKKNNVLNNAIIINWGWNFWVWHPSQSEMVKLTESGGKFTCVSGKF